MLPVAYRRTCLHMEEVGIWCIGVLRGVGIFQTTQFQAPKPSWRNFSPNQPHLNFAEAEPISGLHHSLFQIPSLGHRNEEAVMHG